METALTGKVCLYGKCYMGNFTTFLTCKMIFKDTSKILQKFATCVQISLQWKFLGDSGKTLIECLATCKILQKSVRKFDSGFV